MVGLLKFNIIEEIPFSVYSEIPCITFKTENLSSPTPGSSGPLLALSVFSGHGQRLQHGEVRDTNLAWVGPVELTDHGLGVWLPLDPACARFYCHTIVLNVYGSHVPIWGGVWENEKLYCSQMNIDLVWTIQMAGLWCAAGWASATKLHAFDRDVRLAVVWLCGVASQPMAGHPWSLLMAIWMHTATWRRLLVCTCCPSSVAREGTWPFSRTMLDHMLHVSSLIYFRHENVLVMAWPSMSPDLSPIEHAWDKNGQTVETTTKPARHAARTWWSPARSLARNPTSIPCQPNGINEESCQECFSARGDHTHWQCELLFDPHCAVTS